MRLLFLSNFYPPADLGGWEQWCQEIADEFIARGHEVMILTGRYGLEQINEPEPHVRRVFHLESDIEHYNPWDFLLHFRQRDRYNRRYLRDFIEQFQPDSVVVWGMWQLNPQLAVLVEDLCPGHVAYYFCGFWPIKEYELDPHTKFWAVAENSSDSQGGKLLKQLVGGAIVKWLARRRRRQPQLRHVACVSQFVLAHYRAGGRALPAGQVIYGGIDLEKFYYALDKKGPPRKPLQLLFAGLVAPQKGIDTALAAMVHVAAEFSPQEVHLTVVGGGHPVFTAQLKDFVTTQQLEDYVTFSGRAPKEQMSQLLRAFDVLLFTSAWEEPLSRMMMEGLASGLVLVSTTTGGTKEVLENGKNSLTFEAGNAVDLAQQIARLINEPHVISQLASAGQQTALEKFDFTRMATEIAEFIAVMQE